MPILHLSAEGSARPAAMGTVQGGAGELSRVWDLCRGRACQENAISLHKTCSSPAPLPRQQLKSFLPKLSQYWHIVASVEVLTLVEGAQWGF